MTVFTVGHGTRSVDELVAVLHSAGVGRLIDVRRYPGSRRSPHLSREALPPALAERGVRYQWWGEELGGRRHAGPPPTRHPAWRQPAFRAYAEYTETPRFRQAVTALQDEAARPPPLAVMCSETLWWRCHRRLIADALCLRGTPVVHLLDDRHHQPHPGNDAMRAGEDGWPVYDVTDP